MVEPRRTMPAPLVSTAAPNAPARRARLARWASWLALLATGGVLAGAVVRVTLPDALSEASPAWALAVTSQNPRALTALAAADLALPRQAGAASGQATGRAAAIQAAGVPFPMLAPSLSPAERQALQLRARQALLADPLDDQAMRILGEVADDDTTRMELMRRVAARTRHDTIANYWLMQQACLDRDFATAATYADILMRLQPQLNDLVVPVLARMAERAESSGAVMALLRARPPWSWYFYSKLNDAVAHARTPLDLMLDQKDHGIAPNEDNLADYIAFLMKHDRPELAYYAWSQFLTPEQQEQQSLLFDGGFRVTPSNMPFDWQFSKVAGLRPDIVDAPNLPGLRALLIDFVAGRMTEAGVTQDLVLPPGDYRLTGRFFGDVQAGRGLRWRVACLNPEGPAIGDSALIVGNVPTWRGFAAPFSVPTDGCRAQQVRLDVDASSDSERLVRGAVWFTGLTVEALP